MQKLTKFENISGADKMVKALQTGPIVCYLNLDYDELRRFNEGDLNEGQTKDAKTMVLVVGYGQDENNNKEKFWILKRLWDESGNQESFRIRRGKNSFGIENNCFFMQVDSRIVQDFGFKKEEFGIENYTLRARQISGECGEVSSYLDKKPINRLILVFGPSQSGKSTFINNLIDAGSLAGITIKAQVGVGNGESTTEKITLYNLGSIPGLFPDDIQGFDTVSILDVPGTFDSGLKLTQEEILTLIKMKIIEKSTPHIDCILVFESMNVDSRKVYYSVKTASDLFGSNVTQSIILLTTKWDKVDPNERVQVKEYIDSMAAALNISLMKWQNNYNNKILISDKDFGIQISELGKNIQKIKKYLVQGMDDVIKERDMMAEKLRDEDPDRYSTTQETIEVDVLVEYTDIIDVEVDDIVHLSEDEILQQAKRLYKNQPPPQDIIIDSGRKIKKKVETKIPKIQNEIHANTGKSEKIENKPEKTEYIEEEIEVPEYITTKGETLSEEYFINLIKNQKKLQKNTKQIEMKRVKLEKRNKVIMKNQERHDFEYYQRKATKLIEDKFKDSLKSLV